MVIDAREIELQELFVNLKEIMCSSSGKEVVADIRVRGYGDAKKVTAFASMSGCQTRIENKGEYCIVHISGYACCV